MYVHMLAERRLALRFNNDGVPAWEASAMRYGWPVATRFVARYLGIRPGVEAEDADLAGVGSPQALEALDGGGLAGTVGADHPDDLTGRDVEVEVVDDHAVAVRLAEAADGHGHVERWVRGHGSSLTPVRAPAPPPGGRTSAVPEGGDSAGRRLSRPGSGAARSG